MASNIETRYAPPRPISGQGMKDTFNKIGSVAKSAGDMYVQGAKDFGNRVASIGDSQTVKNIREKGILGSMATGAEQSLDLAKKIGLGAANLSTDAGKLYIEGGKKVLFGTGASDSQRTQGGQVDGGGAGNTNNAGNTGVITPKPIQSNLGNTISPSPIVPTAPTAPTVSKGLGTTTLTQNKGTLSINNGVGGTGTIAFADGRQLSPDRLNKLQSNINFDSSPEQKARFARDAEVVAQRRNEADQVREQIAMRNQREMYQGIIAHEMGKGFVNHNLVNAAMGSLAKMDDTAAEREGANALAQARLGAAQTKAGTDQAKNDLEERQLAFQAQKALAEIASKPEWDMMSPAKRAAIIRGLGLGNPVGGNDLGYMHSQEEINDSPDYNSDDFAEWGRKFGYTNRDINRITGERRSMDSLNNY